MESNIVQMMPKAPQRPEDGAAHGGGDGGDGMMERIAKLEAGQDAIRREMDLRFDHLDKSIGELGKEMLSFRTDITSKMLSKWDVAKVVAGVVGFAMALVLFGPRLISILERAGGV